MLLDELDQEHPRAELAADLWEKDKIFPEIDFRWFQA
jgi:hypothetical protein